MDQSQKLQEILDQNNLPLKHNDRLFYSKYIYRLSIVLPKYRSIWHISSPSEISVIRKFAKKQGDRVRVEGNYLVNYYSNNLYDIDKLVQYIKKIARTQASDDEYVLDYAYVDCISAFPGEVTERNIRYRKKNLPHKKYKFQLCGSRMSHEEILNWREWALQYPDKIKLSPYGTHGTTVHTKLSWSRHWTRTNGIWAGEALGYVEDEKMLQLAQFKLGAHINKIIEYQIRNTENNDE